jgi:tetratricopeptide (TPR) repeat protein
MGEVHELSPGLRRAVEWSWALLDDRERAALAQLSVFRGGFTLALAEQVLALDEEPGRDVLETLHSLREKSLIRVEDSARGPDGRFGLFVAVRHFAAGKLDAMGATRQALTRHAECLLPACEAWSRDILKTDGLVARDRLFDEIDNLMAVWQRTREGLLDGDDRRVRVARALTPLLVLDGMTATAGDMLRTLLGDPHLPRDQEAWCRVQLGRALVHAARITEAIEVLEHATEVARSLGSAQLEGMASTQLGLAYASRGSEELGSAALLQAIRLASLAGDRITQVIASVNLAMVRIFQARLGDARVVLEQVEPVVSAADSWYGWTLFLKVRGCLRSAELRADEALEDSMESARLARRGGAAISLAHALGTASWAHQERGDLASAASLGEDCVRLLRRGGSSLRAACHSVSLALVAQEANDLDGARRILQGALAELRGSGVWFEETIGRATLGGVLAGLDLTSAAEDAFEEARKLVMRDLNQTTAVFLYLEQGLLDLARARSALGQGDTASAAQHLEEARHRLDRSTTRGAHAGSEDRLATREVRVALRVLKVAVELAEALRPPRPDEEGTPLDEPLRISGRGDWIRLPGRPVMAFPKGQPLRSVLIRLARARLASPGEPVSWEQLIEAGWPGETASRAALHRARVTLYRMAKAIGPTLVRAATGAMLDPAVLVVIDAGPLKGEALAGRARSGQGRG